VTSTPPQPSYGWMFWEASGLNTNMTKTSVTPLQCSSTDVDAVQEQLTCQVENFPVKYLGLLLSIKKLTMPQFQPLIYRLADFLPRWKGNLITRAGCAIQVQFVLTATIIYQAMALDIPNWAHKVIHKIRRSYMWRGRKYAKGVGTV
jgi:hypothetical protein